MATVIEVPNGHPAEITGYVDPWISSPGECIDVKVYPEPICLSIPPIRLEMIP